MYLSKQETGFSIVYWADLSRPFLEIEAPYQISEDPDSITFLCFDSVGAMDDHDPTKRYIIPLNSISYIETNFS